VDEVIAWARFAGAWLLVAGPLYQGSVELIELDLDREGIQGKAAAVQAAQARPSAWWLVYCRLGSGRTMPSCGAGGWSAGLEWSVFLQTGR
jgi:hypothetical protein